MTQKLQGYPYRIWHVVFKRIGVIRKGIGIGIIKSTIRFGMKETEYFKIEFLFGLTEYEYLFFEFGLKETEFSILTE